MLNLRTLVFTLFAFAATLAMAEPSVVLDSNTNSYKAGQQFASGQMIQLKAGERLTLITESGSSIELVGPFGGTVKAPGGAATNAKAKADINSNSGAVPPKQLKTLVQRLTAQKAVETSALGVIRQPLPQVVYSPAEGLKGLLQDIPVGLNGKFCVNSVGLQGKASIVTPRFKFFEPNETSNSRLMLKTTGGRYVQLSQGSQQGVWNWPKALKAKTGRPYLLRDGEVSIPYVVELVAVQLPKPDQSSALPASLAYTATVLAAKGCTWQAQVLTQSEQF